MIGDASNSDNKTGGQQLNMGEPSSKSHSGIFSKMKALLSMAFADRNKEERFLNQQRDDTAKHLSWACLVGALIMIGFIWQDALISENGQKAMNLRIFGALPVAALAWYLSRNLRVRRFISYISAFFWLSYACFTAAILIIYGPGPYGLTSSIGLGSFLLILFGILAFSNLRLWACILVGLLILLIYAGSVALWTEEVFVDFIMGDLSTAVALMIGAAIKTLFTERAQRRQFETSELLHQSYSAIEQQVQKRTAELQVTNTILTAEITERKRAEDTLKESEKKFRTVVEEAVEIVFTVDNHGYFTYVNPSGIKSSGYSLNELKQLKYVDLVESIYKQRVSRSYFRQYLDRSELSNTEYPFLTKSGEIKWFNQNARLIIENDEVKGFYVIARDVTERRKVEETLRESEEKYRELVEASPDAIIIYSDEKIVFANRSSVSLMRASSVDELIGKPVIEFIHPAYKEFVIKRIMKIIKSEEELPLAEEKFIRLDGSEVDVEVKAMPVVFNKKQAVQVIVRDITERKRAEEKIVMLAQSLKTINECVSVTDMEDKILFVNESFLKTYGYDENELMGKHINIVRSLNNPPELIKEISPTTKRGGWQGELWNKREDGSEFPIFLSTTIIFDKEDKPLGLIGVATDITERIRVEKELIGAKEKAEESDKLKSQFLAQMSHEIRTPLNSIVGNVEYLNESFGKKMDSDTRDCFEGIDLASKRIIRTIDLILNAAELQTSGYQPQFVKIDLNSDVLKILYQEHQLSAKQKGLEFIYTCKEKNTKVIADGYSITQIFANLIDNAIKYTKKGKIEILLGKNTTGNIMVEVKDTGIGMSKEFLPKLFEPFVQEEQGYTRSFEGNGLGLALVKRYCELNNIIIEVESEKNVGSTFRIIFDKKVTEA